MHHNLDMRRKEQNNFSLSQKENIIFFSPTLNIALKQLCLTYLIFTKSRSLIG